MAEFDTAQISGVLYPEFRSARKRFVSQKTNGVYFLMAISGLVVTLSDDAAAVTARSALAAHPCLTIGDQFDRRVALVAETTSVEEDRALWEELRAMPGIVNVDVMYVYLDPAPIPSPESGAGALENRHADR